MTGKERILRALQGEEVDCLPLMPITMMFAGDEAGVSYRDYVTDYRVLAAAQQRTAAKYNFDYVSVISDPCREVADLGGEVEWFDNQPPALAESEALLSTKERLQSLPYPDPMKPGSRMRDRIDGVRLLAERCGEDLVVEGWVEGPCAMAADLRGVNTLMLDLHDDDTFIHDLFDFAVEMELRFARAQVDAGATLIGIGDAAASLIGPKLYDRLVLPFEKKLIAGIRAMGAKTRLHICGNTRRILGGMGQTGADMIDLDYPSPMGEARAAMHADQVISGNLDPVRAVRDSNPETIEGALAECHRQAGQHYIVCAGCEIPRGTPEANVLAMTHYAKSHMPALSRA